MLKTRSGPRGLSMDSGLRRNDTEARTSPDALFTSPLIGDWVGG